MKLDHIMFLVFFAAVAFFYFKKPASMTLQAPSVVQASAPWFLLYNYPLGFTGASTPALPSRSIGQANANTSPECAICSLFPITDTAQY